MEGSLPSTAWLERANRLALIARLLSSAVHDINNALQVISGNGELLELAAGADPAVIKRGQTIRTHAQRASGLLTELMAFARDGNESARPVTLRSIATQALSMRQYAVTKLRVVAAVEGVEGKVFASPRYLVQVALNLVSNAEQALAGRTGGMLRLQVSTDGDRALLTVTDNGPGLDPRVEQRLFVGGPQPIDSADGLGIGLGVSKWLIEQQGGSLAYAPAAGGGSAFTVSLPVATS
jgi:C4-dicarboxylate-specific signal transduction histidine kinase